MLEAGDRVPPEPRVWLEPRVSHTLGEIVADGSILLVFYLFDWSST